MTRAAGWDLTSGVGATATLAAAARALATAEPGPIINDPFAAPLVRAVGVDVFTRWADGHLTRPGNQLPGVQSMTTAQAVRTRCYDEFFLDAMRDATDDTAHPDPRQAVILAAGLDSRAYRLAWPPGSTVYEVDRPRVVDFKTATMSALGVRPTAQRRAVGVDLRGDWPNALRRGGFDDTRPAVWTAEGLLRYLPPDAQDRLFDDLTALSAPGSRLATEYEPGGEYHRATPVLTSIWRQHGYDVDIAGSFCPGERNNVADYLTDRGWQVTIRPFRAAFADYGREFPAAAASSWDIGVLTATRS